MRLKAELRAVNTILWKDWDPIGCGVPEDEYESYAPDVLRLLKDNAGRATLAAHLQSVAKESLSCPISEARAAGVADKLLALGIR